MRPLTDCEKQLLRAIFEVKNKSGSNNCMSQGDGHLIPMARHQYNSFNREPDLLVSLVSLVTSAQSMANRTALAEVTEERHEYQFRQSPHIRKSLNQVSGFDFPMMS